MTRTILAALFALILTAPLAAEETPSPAFFIERIEVRNAKRVSPAVVIAESRLREGREYSEAELRDASTRLSRLPFLLSVDFALEKGSERGKHVLVLSIVETKPFFYQLDIRPIFDQPSGPRVIDYSDRIGTSDGQGTVGFRWFVGSRGAFHVGIYTQDDNNNYSTDYTSITAGYTQYDLFGTRAFATINLKRPLDGYGGGIVSPQVVVGIPLSPNQTLTLQADELRRSSESGVTIVYPPDKVEHFTTRADMRQQTFSARWSYNTTNHPFLPTRGTVVSVTPGYFMSDFGAFDFLYDPGQGHSVPMPRSGHLNMWTIDGSAAQYFEVSDRDSVSGGLRLSWWTGDGRSTPPPYRPEDESTYFGVVFAGYSHSLWDRSRNRDGDSRLELNLRYSTRDADSVGGYYPNDTTQISASWVRRSSWGTLRLGAGYAW